MENTFADRRDAGLRLAEALAEFQGAPDILVLGLPRGGIPVAFEVARALDAPLDVFVVRKIGAPGHPELAMGAIAGENLRVLNEEVVSSLHIRPEEIEAVTSRERKELKRREEAYRRGRAALAVTDRTVILADDGLATGATMRAAVRALRSLNPKRIVVAVPVAPTSACKALRKEADEVICLQTPRWFSAVGQWYADFRQTTDEEVIELLAKAAGEASGP